MNKRINRKWRVSLLLTAFLLTACGGADSATATPRPTRTPFPTFAFVEPTKPPAFDQDDEAADDVQDDEAEIQLDPKKVERGLGRYEALACAACHGEGGVGEDGKSLLDFALSEEDFITFMRSGGSLGPAHQYSTNRLSDSGSRNLYQYLLSLSAR